MCLSDNSNTFFDSVFTLFNETLQVGCCHPNMTMTTVTCGLGMSCTGKCSAIDASLCPSGLCTDDPRDCNLNLEAEEERLRSGGTSFATLSFWQLRRCAPGCRVKQTPACCFHPQCTKCVNNKCSKKEKRNRRLCNFLSFFSGSVILWELTESHLSSKVNMMWDGGVP